jgi:hypothetical protein
VKKVVLVTNGIIQMKNNRRIEARIAVGVASSKFLIRAGTA